MFVDEFVVDPGVGDAVLVYTGTKTEGRRMYFYIAANRFYWMLRKYTL